MKNTILLLVSIFILSSCNMDSDDLTNNDPDTSTPAIASIDITDAQNLFIAPGFSGSSNSNAVLHKTLNNSTEIVDFYDENGDVIDIYSSNRAERLYNTNTDYFILCLLDEGFLISKTDGAAYSLNDAGMPDSNEYGGKFKNVSKVQTDAYGNIYYPTNYKTIKKIDISNPDNLIAYNYLTLPDSDTLTGFLISDDCHVVYNYDPGYSYRIMKANGGLYNLPSGGWIAFWNGLDGSIKYDDSNGNIVTVNIDSEYNVTESATTSGFYLGDVGNLYLLGFSDRAITVDAVSGFGIHEVENPGNSPRTITIADISDIEIAGQSNQYYYLSGCDSSNNPLLLKINPDDDSVITLLQPGDYDIYSMTVSADDEILFNALRMSDGRKVIGKITGTGTVSIIDNEINSIVTSLTKIN